MDDFRDDLTSKQDKVHLFDALMAEREVVLEREDGAVERLFELEREVRLERAEAAASNLKRCLSQASKQSSVSAQHAEDRTHKPCQASRAGWGSSGAG